MAFDGKGKATSNSAVMRPKARGERVIRVSSDEKPVCRFETRVARDEPQQ
jgi:hypothetical protein